MHVYMFHNWCSNEWWSQPIAIPSCTLDQIQSMLEFSLLIGHFPRIPEDMKDVINVGNLVSVIHNYTLQHTHTPTHARVHTHIHTHTLKHAHMHIYAHACTGRQTHRHAHTQTHTYVIMYVCSYRDAQTKTCTDIHTQSLIANSQSIDF